MSAPKIIAWDIETGGLEPERIVQIAPDFKEDSVKVGNLGIEKAVEKINASRISHYDKINSEAALNAEYGQVLAIGWTEDPIDPDDKDAVFTGDFVIVDEEDGSDERHVIKSFWDRISLALVAGRFKELWVGHNIFGFDLPFLMRRSLILGIDFPLGILKSGRYWSDIFVDTMSLFAAGEYRKTISLDRFCKACGLPGKSGSGEHFATLLQEDREAAIGYLTHDLAITSLLAQQVVPVAIREVFISEVSS